MSKLQNRSRILFFITASFPFGNDEVFIESEIEFLALSFNKIVIISHDEQSSYLRSLPSNVQVVRKPYSRNLNRKLNVFKCLLSREFWAEYRMMVTKYSKGLSLGSLKTCLISLANAKDLANVYENIVLNFQENQPIFYSYWCNDSAIAIALIKSKNSQIKSVCRIHGWDVYFEASKYKYLPFRHFITNHLDRVFSISKNGIKECFSIWKIESPKIVLSRLGVVERSNDYIVQETFDSTINLVSCSNVISLKRLHLIIGALSMISNKKIHWVHFGGGVLLNEMKLLAHKKIKNSGVTFEFKGKVHNYEVHKYYRDCVVDLFINVSSSEGVPVSIMEAMSWSVPCIASDVGGNSEIVNEDNGFLLGSNPKIEAIAKKIECYCELSQANRNAYRKNAFFTWKNKFNAAKNYSTFSEELKSL